MRPSCRCSPTPTPAPAPPIPSRRDPAWTALPEATRREATRLLAQMLRARNTAAAAAKGGGRER